MTLNEKQIREIIREELKNFKENEKNFDEKSLNKKTEIVTASVGKTILYWLAIGFLAFYGLIFGIAIIAKIIEFFMYK